MLHAAVSEDLGLGRAVGRELQGVADQDLGRDWGVPGESLSGIGNHVGNIAGNIPDDFCESGTLSGASPGCLKRTIPGHGHGIGDSQHQR